MEEQDVKRVKLAENHEFNLPIRNKKKEIVAYTLVDEDDYEKYKEVKLSLTRDGYATTTKQGRFHRVLMNAQPGQIIDHINNNKLDNRKNNLRFVTALQNARNKRKNNMTTSKYYGVSWCSMYNKWTSQVTLPSGKHLRFSFNKEDHAAYWRDVLVRQNGLSGSKMNDIEKPVDFSDPIIATRSRGSDIQQRESGNFRVRISRNGSRVSVGTFKTKEEAVVAYNEKKLALDKQAETKRLSQSIKRNSDGIAVIELFKNNEKVGECLVDDDRYYALSKYSWTLNANGYATTRVNNRNMTMHRYLMNAGTGDLIDHINNNRLDNRLSNLRFSTPALNVHNKTKQKNVTSKYYGVSLSRRAGGISKYTARIRKDGKGYHLGYFFNEHDAVRAYNAKAVELYGEYAKLNILPE